MGLLRRLVPRKLSWQMMLIFIMITVVPFTVLSTLTLNRMADETDREAENRMAQMIRLTASSLNARFRAINAITEKIYLYYIYSDQGIRMDLESILKASANYQASVANYAAGILENDEFIRNVLFIDVLNDRVYPASTSFFSTVRIDWQYRQWDFLKEAALTPRRVTISKPHLEDYFLHGTHQVISFCRPFLSLDALPYHETILGYLVLDVDTSVFGETFQAYHWQETGRLYVTDRDGTALYADDPDLCGQPVIRPVSSDIRVLTEDIPACRWRIEYHLDKKLLTEGIHRLRDRLLMMSAVTLIAMALATWITSRRISMPVSRMLEQMDRVQQGDLTARVPVKGRDELSSLGDGFNRMVSRLDTHIRQSYIASIKQKEAELDALRMQIHPHYLYNTLEVIRMSSVAHKDQETAQMTLSLVRQLQYVIGESREQVPLSKELEIVRDYVSLVSLRYGRIDLTSSVPPPLMNCSILKMTLQPIVENAVQHGLRPLGGGQISISAAREGDRLLLTVMDNGCGMDAEQLERLRAQLGSDALPEVKEDGLRSIGTKNVHDRIRLACGGQYGLEIESGEGVGTAVVIRLPYQMTEGPHETADR